MAQDADEAMSESSWTALAKEKERDWRSIDLEESDSGRYRRGRKTICVRLWQSARKRQRKWASCSAPLVNHEGPFAGATIDAVKKPSDTG